MKPKENHLLFYLFLPFLLLSCSTAKVKNLTNKGKEIRKIENVEIIAQNENIKHSGEKIADFVLKENPIFNGSYNIDWEEVKIKMNKLAISSGANLIEVSQIGYGIKGNVFYVDGKLFYSENQKLNSKENEPCSIVIFRDGMESLLGSAFTIDIIIDGKEFKNINKDNYAKTEFDNCLRNVDLVINKDTHNLELIGKSKYFKVSKSTSGNSASGGIQIGIGGIVLVEIEDKDLGRLMMFQN
ncbi:hypothetical protein [Lacinutrix salivirga]